MSVRQPALRISILTICIFLCLGSSLRAERATPQEMDQVSENWLSAVLFAKGQWGESTTPAITGFEPIMVNDTVVGRCYHVSPKGYVVVPVMKEIAPVKATSEESNLDVNAEGGFAALIREVLIDGVRSFVELYGTLDAVQVPEKGVAPFGTEYRSQWDRYAVAAQEFDLRLTTEKAKNTDEVGPLLVNSWHQGAPYYNYCPMGDGGRCVVGCVATAASQILHYHQWPPFGNGSKTYWWNGDVSCGDETPGTFLTGHFDDDYDWENILSYVGVNAPQAQQDAVAELCSEVGIAYSMIYGRCGSGSYVFKGVDVFPDYFRYRDTVERIDRLGHTVQDWFDLAQEEIDEARPIAYRITSHAIVLDGWRIIDNQNQLHYNYGWGGSHTAWYATDYVYCPWDGCAASDQMMLRRIIPDRRVIFTADTVVGWLPIEVSFEGSSELNVDSWTYDFGDGDSAFVQNPTHVFDTPGRYDVTLQVTANGEPQTMLRPDLIIAIADTMAAVDVDIAPDSTGEVVIYARNSAPVSIFTIPVEYAGDLGMTLDSFTTEGCRTDFFEEVSQTHFSSTGQRTTFRLQNSTNGSQPELDAGAGPILRLFFSVPYSSSTGEVNPIVIQGYLDNIPGYAGSVIDYKPDLIDGQVVCASCCGGIRGNVDADPIDEVTISDLVYLVTYMFNDGPDPECWKEADLNGTRDVDIADLIMLVDYMFAGGYPPLNCP